MTRNDKFFNDIVKGKYGRKIAYTNVESITEDNIVDVVGNCIGTFYNNRTAIEYLWNYYKGDQPALYRQKAIRDDVLNLVVENHAWEVVAFKTAQSYGEPIQIVALTDNDAVNKSVDTFNNYMRVANKAVKDIECGTWQSAVGTGYKAVQMTGNKDLPFRVTVPTPLNTFVIYSQYTEEPLLAVQQLKDEEGETYFLCFSNSHQYKIQNSKLVPFMVNDDNVVMSQLHAYGGIPIVEYPNNPERISDIELIITILDAINNMQSNRMDAVEQFVQSWVKFINCDIDQELFEQMKTMGALAVNSNGEKNADVDIMSQELKQSESQIAKDDLWDNALSISAIPNKQKGSDGGSTQGAVELRSGWDFSKSRAKIKDPFIIESERKIDKVILNIIRVKGNDDCRIGLFDYDVQINHSPTDNMQVKVQSLQMLLGAGINPLVAIRTVGLFDDAEKVFSLSKPYLDVLYKTIDEIDDIEEQTRKAQELLNNGNAQ